MGGYAARWIVVSLAACAAALIGLSAGTMMTSRGAGCSDSWVGGTGSWSDKSMWTSGVPAERCRLHHGAEGFHRHR